MNFPVQPLTEDETKMLLTCLVAEKKGIDPLKPDDEEEPFLLQVLDKRISALELPIKFTPAARLATLALTGGTPGRMVVLLIDALTQFEGCTLTVSDLCALYPFGTYTEDGFADYVDNYIKPRKVKWAEIY